MDPVTLTIASAAMTVVGGIQQSNAIRSAAKQNQMQAEYKAGQETAVGQHQAEASRAKAELMLSRARAVAAASGGGALDETLAEGIFGQGEKAAGFDLYGSQETAKGLRYQGEVGKQTARAEANATLLSSFGKAAGSMSSFAPKG